MKHVKTILALLLTTFLFSGCGATDESQINSTIPTIHTTIYPLQYLVEQIAEDTVNVVSVYPPGVDEHTYEPTAKDITQIADGAAFFYIGAGLEALATTTAEALKDQTVRLIAIGQHEELFIKGDHDHHDEAQEVEDHQHSDIDPHIWLDPIRMIEMAEVVNNELIKLFPEHEALYYENMNQLEMKLTDLHEEFERLLENKKNKAILVTHAAFGYWEERYGIEQISIHGLSTENEPSQKELIALIETVKEHDINHIIFEHNVSTRIADVIQDEIKADRLIIHNIAVLTEEDIAENRDYISIMQDNLQVLDKALSE